MITPIAATSPQTVTRVRYTTAQTRGSDGRKAANVGTPTDFVGVVAPASPKQMELLPDGMRSRQAVSVLAYIDLRPADQHNRTPADEVIVGGVTYQVQRVDEWPAVGPVPQNWQALAVRWAENQPRNGP